MKETTKKLLNYLFPAFIYSGLKIVYHWLNPILIFFYKIYFRIKLISIRLNHKKALKIVQRKNKIKVVFFLIHEAVWKYEGVYRLMEKNERFEPLVVVCPYIAYGVETMLHEMNQAYNSFKDKNYNVVKTLNEKTGEWLDVKKEINPDIVFFTNPWDLTRKEYYITNFKDTLTCYVPYFIHVTKHLVENYGGLLQNTVWKAFYETNHHLIYSKKISLNSAMNVKITGYPGLDPFLFDTELVNGLWKKDDRNMKKVIWAPHHTIEGQDVGLKLSNFKRYSEFFLFLAQKYNTKIQFAFKPHPLLKPKLYNDPEWGYQKTNEYYQMWNTHDNTTLVDGCYVELFISSDAMIHDSGSFTVEYLALNRPVLYTLSNDSQLDSLNDFGKEAVKQHYLAYSESDIIRFIEDIILKNHDPMKSKRTDFVNNNLVPPNKRSASENIYNELLLSLGDIKKQKK